jgi:hypothetical protein
MYGFARTGSYVGPMGDAPKRMAVFSGQMRISSETVFTGTKFASHAVGSI